MELVKGVLGAICLNYAIKTLTNPLNSPILRVWENIIKKS